MWGAPKCTYSLSSNPRLTPKLGMREEDSEQSGGYQVGKQETMSRDFSCCPLQRRQFGV